MSQVIYEQKTDLRVGINIGALERVAPLHDVLDLALHLADVQAGDGELFLEFADGVHVQFEVELGAADRGADLGEVPQQAGEQLGDALALVRGHVAQLLQLGRGRRERALTNNVN